MRVVYIAAIVVISIPPISAEEKAAGRAFCSEVQSGHLQDLGFGPGSMNGPSLCQDFGSAQDIEQDILNDTGQVLFSSSSPNSEVPIVLQQTAANVVNYVKVDQDFKMVAQQFSGEQNITNNIITGALGALTSISQEGSNTANTVQGATIELAVQVMAGGAQRVANTADVGGALSGISQAGSNVANLAHAEHAIGVGYQDIDNSSTQIIENTLNLGARSDVADRILQSGTNIGNVLIAERVDEVIRRFEGVQRVENTVILNDGYRPRVNQSGNNIANFISAKSVGSIQQISAGQQRVINTVRDADGVEIRHANFEQSQSNYMGVSNVVNLMVIEPGSGQSRNNDEMEITQDASFDQSASGSNGQSQSGNVLVINR